MIANILKDGNLLYSRLYAYLVRHYDLTRVGRTRWMWRDPVSGLAGSSEPGKAGRRSAHPICYIAICDLASRVPTTESNVFLWPPIRDLSFRALFSAGSLSDYAENED